MGTEFSSEDGRGREKQSGAEPNTVENPVDFEAAIDALPVPVYLLDSQHTVVAWSDGLETLLGLEKEEMLGHDDLFGRDDDGNLIKTLSNHIVDDPDHAEKNEFVNRVESEYTDEQVYESPLWLQNDAGEDRFIRFTAAPIYENGKLQAVVQMCRDETEQRRKQEATEALLEEIIATMEQLGAGELGARASFDREDDVEPHLLEVLSQINEMAASLESGMSEVDDQAAAVSDSAAVTADSAEQINELVEKQCRELDSAVAELQDFSARMEEIAATSKQVATAATDTQEAAENGLTASKDAHKSSAALVETGEGLVETVHELEADVKRIDDIVDVIQDIADQTDMLALNASIEAARADDDGGGFAVVAEEVKQLAEETSTNAEKISEQVTQMQDQTQRTVEGIETTSEEISAGMEDISEALNELETIEELVAGVSDSIDEIATANDRQAETIEKLTVSLDEIKDQAMETESASEQIVQQTHQQQAAIRALTAAVEEMTATESA